MRGNCQKIRFSPTQLQMSSFPASLSCYVTLGAIYFTPFVSPLQVNKTTVYITGFTQNLITTDLQFGLQGKSSGWFVKGFNESARPLTMHKNYHP